MTIQFLNYEELIKKVILKKVSDDTTIIRLDTQEEMTIPEFLKLKMLEIQKIEKFAIC